MSYTNHNTKEIDYEYRKRDLATKYSYAISRLGSVDVEKKQYWRDQLASVSQKQQELEREYRK